ncbi:unnamed protein product [Ilex paraguariensis]|uniref:Eukaryotic translation initiation factor 3 subunit A n=1 Tax=Ilex paraguariensis TaxID=185542 RepID=A0ABC8V5E0_9AQUA
MFLNFAVQSLELLMFPLLVICQYLSCPFIVHNNGAFSWHQMFLASSNIIFFILQELFQERVVSRREMEFSRLKEEREERVNQIIQSRKQEREVRRKMIFNLKSEEERLEKFREAEEARKREEAERRRKEDAERKAKLDEIAEKQRQRELELEEKERRRKEEEVFRKPTAAPPRPSEPSAIAHPSEPVPVAPTAAAPAPGKYVPRFKRDKGESLSQAPPLQADRWGSGGRQDDQASQESDRWRDDRRPSFGSGGGALRSTWSYSKTRG